MSTFLQSKFERLVLRWHAPVARITLHNPPVNVIDLGVMDEMAEALSEIEANSGISIIVLGGDGPSFSAGVDVAAHTADQASAMLSKFHGVIRSLIATRRVTVAAVHGNCLGGGAELAMVCDMVYTTASARWGFPEIRLGCYPPVACTALSALVGQKRAAELILTGRTITGAEAAAMGLANQALDDEDLTLNVERVVQELSKLSAAALSNTKNALCTWEAVHFEKGLARAEKIYMEELMKTSDAREGIAAFLERRPPRWTGK
jgi:cyclohexa-1,5-dienecarbonyl-CoA hydratase